MNSILYILALSRGVFMGLLHSHSTFMLIYTLHLAFKVILLLGENHILLEKYRKYTRVIGEMIIPSIALATGVTLFIIGDYEFIDFYMLLKWIGLVASIPLGIIAFKRNNKFFAVSSLFLLIACIILAYTKPKRHSPVDVSNDKNISPEQKIAILNKGMVIYNSNCTLCHGSDGKLGLNGAKSLAASSLPDDVIKDQVMNGKNLMPAYKEKISNPEDLDALVLYVKSLRR